MQRLRQTLWFGWIFLILISVLCACKGQVEGLEEVSVANSSTSRTAQEDSAAGKEDRAEDEETETERYSDEAQTQGQEPSIICVHVCGQVIRPGVYELEAGGRVFEAIEAAGGMTEEAADNWLNQAERLSDGQQVYVPDKEEALQMGEARSVPGINSESSQNADDRVNLNTATKEELMTLSGIGEARAESILAYRTERGGFQSIEEIQQVEGIKSGIYNRIKDKIMI